jgi:hypothetical protein
VNGPADDDRRPRRSIDVDRQYLPIRIHPRGLRMRYHFDPSYTLGPRRSGSSDNPTMRVSDTERNDVAESLSRHFADGRLNEMEFKERLDQAMGAKTRGDLSGLFNDLPRLPTPAQAQLPRRRRRLVPFLLILAFLVVAADITVPWAPFVHGPHLTWLLFVLAGLYFWTRTRHHHHHARD